MPIEYRKVKGSSQPMAIWPNGADDPELAKMLGSMSKKERVAWEQEQLELAQRHKALSAQLEKEVTEKHRPKRQLAKEEAAITRKEAKAKATKEAKANLQAEKKRQDRLEELAEAKRK